MSESQSTLFQPEFNRSVHVETRPERLSADAGAILMRELMDRTGLSGLLEDRLTDPRDGARTTHPFPELVRTHLLLEAQGWSTHEDVDLLREDPCLRLAVSGRRGQRPLRPPRTPREPEGLCSQPTLSRLLAALATDGNRAALQEVLLAWGERRLGRRLRRDAAAGQPREELTLDLDSLPIEVYGHQPGSGYNGHYGLRCMHPLVVRSETGEFLGGKLRPGNAHTATGGLEFVLPVLERFRTLVRRLWLRIDAGFPGPKLLRALEALGIRYVARLKTNDVLERKAEPYLSRPVGRPPTEGRIWFHELSYAAGSWERERRVVLVVLERPGEQGHLFLDHFFLLTNVSSEEEGAEELLTRYRGRGRAEKDFGDWQSALDLRLSSTPRPKSHYRDRPVRTPGPDPDSFGANEARLLLSLLTANLLRAGTELLARERDAVLSRTRFRTLVLKCAGRVLFGSRQITLVLGRTTGALWTRFWSALEDLHPPRGSPHVRTLPSAT